MDDDALLRRGGRVQIERHRRLEPTYEARLRGIECVKVEKIVGLKAGGDAIAHHFEQRRAHRRAGGARPVGARPVGARSVGARPVGACARTARRARHQLRELVKQEGERAVRARAVREHHREQRLYGWVTG